jgi:hypothetical protein
MLAAFAPCANSVRKSEILCGYLERTAIQEREKLKRETRLTLVGYFTLCRCRCPAVKMHVLVVRVANEPL